MLISFIIPTYNDELYIEKCIQSLLIQTYSQIEIIIINDGSSDRTLEIINKLSSLDVRIKIHSTENLGVSNARNLGLSFAHGEYVCFIDADDELTSNATEILVNKVKTFKGLDGIVFNGKAIYEEKFLNQMPTNVQATYNLSYKLNILPNKVYEYKDFLLNQFKGNHFRGGIVFYLFKTSKLKEFQILFNPTYSYYEDLLFQYQLMKCMNQVYYLNKELYLRRLTGISAVTNLDNLELMVKDGINFINYLIDRLNMNKDELTLYFLLHVLNEVVTRNYRLPINKQNKYIIKNAQLNEFFKNMEEIVIEKVRLQTNFENLIKHRNM